LTIPCALLRNANGTPELIPLVWELEAGRHDANHGVRLAVRRNRLPDDRGICTVATLPERITQEHHLVAAAFVLLRTKPAAEERLHVERVEKPGRDHLSRDELRLAPPRQREPGANVPAERFERPCLTLEVEKVLRAEPRPEHWCWMLLIDDEQARCVTVRDGCSRTALTIEKMAVLAPMPNASVSTATAAKLLC
jgi:hypothetical protein